MNHTRRRARPAFAGRLALLTIAVTLAASTFTGLGPAGAEEQPGATAPTAPTAPAGAPGDVISAEPYSFKVVPGLPTPTKAWKIFYHSTDALGQPSVVSGTVIVPEDGKTGTRPLVTYAVGTVGMGDQCAPSATFIQGKNLEGMSVGELLMRGWAVAVTDYPGLGTPGDHPYLVGRSEGTAVLDAARAAQRLPELRQAGVSPASPVGIMGYSQGGQASAWAAELAGEYAPELQVKAAASGGVPADVLKDALDKNGSDGNPAASLMVAIGHDAAYPELDLDSYLTAQGRDLVQQLRGGCVLDNVRAGEGHSLNEALARNPLDDPQWRQRLGEDRLGSVRTAFPLYLFHGTTDQVVSYGLGEQLRADWCAGGNTVEWHAYPLADHAGAVMIGGDDAVDWLGERLNGRPAQGNCGS
ncbi:lipase [Nocardia cyriacigeorgica]|uniref:lipase family protein n=1 Tax=Nocardia cyriacigeorgica TaxID=135487 RepID=UPI001893B4AE|nr:lipase family protein [Nocardia cyriacigeorgica]MBF6428235.1 lipase [Nocardia cyriacigeorgica]